MWFHILRRAFKDSESEEEEGAAGTEIITRHGAQTTTTFRTVFARTVFDLYRRNIRKDAQACNVAFLVNGFSHLPLAHLEQAKLLPPIHREERLRERKSRYTSCSASVRYLS